MAYYPDAGTLAITDQVLVYQNDAKIHGASPQSLVDWLANAGVALKLGTTAGTAAAGNDSRITGALQVSNYFGEITATGNASMARTNLGVAYGTSAGTVAEGNDSRITGALQASMATPLFFAKNYGSCTWDSTHDVGPCIQSAINAAAAAGGGKVMVPAGTYGQATALVNNTSGVSLVGAGVGIIRDNASPGAALAATRLLWIGAANATMLDVEPAGGATVSMYSADVRGITFDCNNIAAICVKIAQVSFSTFDFQVSEPRSIGAYLTTTTIADAPGTQHNDVWISSRSTSSSYSPTGILLDGGVGSSWNVSYNRFHRLSAWYAKGDGIVFGNADNNIVDKLTTFPNPGNATGRPVVFANSHYTMPNGIATSGYQAYEHHVQHLGATVAVLGYQTGSTITAGSNAGTGAVSTVTLTTNASTSYPSNVLNFASTTGVVAGMSVSCGSGPNSGVMPDSIVRSVASTTVTLRYQSISTVNSGTSCTFGYGVTYSAVPGTYTITATSGTTFNITAPAGGHSQTGVAISGGVVNFTDLVIPLSGTPQAGDTWTLTVPSPASNIQFAFVDAANSVPLPMFEAGATGYEQMSNAAYPQIAGPLGAILITTDSATTLGSSSGQNSVSIGQSSAVSGFFATGVGGAGTVASGPYSFVTGHNTVASGTASAAFGEATTADGTYSFATGGNVTARGRYGVDVYGSGQIATAGDAQIARGVLRVRTSSTSQTTLTADGTGTASSTNCFNIPDNTAYSIRRVSLIYRDTSTKQAANWYADNLLLTRDSGVGTTALASAPITMTAAQTKGAPTITAPTITADTTNGCLAVKVTAPNSDATDWVASIEAVEVQ